MNGRITMRLAAIYNILWGLWVVIFPEQFFKWTGMVIINYIVIWQCLGMVIGLYGLAYWWAGYDPVKYWPVIAIGLLGKILGPLGFFINYMSGKIPGVFIYTLITNDFIWWIPFGIILLNIYKKNVKLQMTNFK